MPHQLQLNAVYFMRAQDITQDPMSIQVDIEQRPPTSHPLRKVKIKAGGNLHFLGEEFDRRHSWIGHPLTPTELRSRRLLQQVTYIVSAKIF